MNKTMEQWEQQAEEQLQKAIAEDWQQLKIPYRQTFLNDLKSSVPSTCRSWDKPNKVWYISPRFEEIVQVLVKKHFTTLRGMDYTEAWRVLHLRENAPGFLIEVVASCLLENETRARQREQIATAKELLLNF